MPSPATPLSSASCSETFHPYQYAAARTQIVLPRHHHLNSPSTSTECRHSAISKTITRVRTRKASSVLVWELAKMVKTRCPGQLWTAQWLSVAHRRKQKYPKCGLGSGPRMRSAAEAPGRNLARQQKVRKGTREISEWRLVVVVLWSRRASQGARRVSETENQGLG